MEIQFYVKGNSTDKNEPVPALDWYSKSPL